MKRKLISLLFTVLMIMTLYPSMGANATSSNKVVDSGKCGNNLTWTLDNEGNLIVLGTGMMWDYEEPLWQGNTQKSNVSPWYKYRNKILSVYITNGVKNIGNYAFSSELEGSEGYIKLNNLIIDGSVNIIGECAFLYSGLKNVTFTGSGLTEIKQSAFLGTDIENIALPDTLEIIGFRAFALTKMKSVNIPISVTSIADQAFGFNYPFEGGACPLNGFTIYGYAGSEAEKYYQLCLVPSYNEMKEWVYSWGNDYDDPYIRENFFSENAISFYACKAGLSFYDVFEDSWFGDYVKYAVKKGWMNGVGNNLFSPNTSVTRAQIITMLHRMAGTSKASGTTFNDVKASDYFYDAVQWGSKNGIIIGYGDGNFRPNDVLSREQMATIFFRYARFKSYDTRANADINTFSDGGRVSSYAKYAMKWAVGAGLINGTDDGKLAPSSSATRAQSAAILERFDENVSGTKANNTKLDKLLSKKPASGDKELALIAADLSLKTYDNDGANDESVRGYLIYDLGFDDSNIYSNNYGGSLAYTVATKEYKESGSDGNTDILVIVARGSQSEYELYMDKFSQAKEYYGSYRMYDIVKDFRNAIYEGLQKVIDSNKSYKVLVTGHSLGGASANLVAAQIIDGYANANRNEEAVKINNSSKDVFCYTFGAIDSIVTDGTVFKGYEGIHNITNYYNSFGPNGWPDFASAAGNSRYGKFGHIDLFENDIDKGANGAHKNHDMDTYRDAVQNGLVRYEKSSDQKYSELSGGGGGISGR